MLVFRGHWIPEFIQVETCLSHQQKAKKKQLSKALWSEKDRNQFVFCKTKRYQNSRLNEKVLICIFPPAHKSSANLFQMCICKIRFLLCICVLCVFNITLCFQQSDDKLPVIYLFIYLFIFSHICSQTIFCTSAEMTFFWELQSRAKEVTMTDGKWEARCHDESERERERERARERSWEKKVWECVLVVVQQQQQGSLCFSPSALFFTSRISHSRHVKTQSTGVSLLWGLCAWEGECDTVGGEVNKNELRGDNRRRRLHCTERTDCTERDLFRLNILLKKLNRVTSLHCNRPHHSLMLS